MKIDVFDSMIQNYSSLFDDAKKIVSSLSDDLEKPRVYFVNETIHLDWSFGYYPKFFISIYNSDFKGSSINYCSYRCELNRWEDVGDVFDCKAVIPKEMIDLLDKYFKE